MADSLAAPLAGVALAAGAGTRLAPLTRSRPKVLCPVGDRALLDHALDALLPAVTEAAVNAHHHAEQVRAHVERRIDDGDPLHLSHEQQRALGTAGAIGALRGWLAGRSALIVNADTVHDARLARFAADWDGASVRVLTPTPLPFGPRSGVVASILPWDLAVEIPAEPAGLWERVWAGALAEGRLEAVHHDGRAVDCATPADYLRANLELSGGESVIGEGAVVEGLVDRCVIWPGNASRPASGWSTRSAATAARSSSADPAPPAPLRLVL